MLVYAELYRQCSGVYPAKAVLYFLGEIKDTDPAKGIRPLRAVTEILIAPTEVKEALIEFDKSAKEIMQCSALGTWPLPAVSPPAGTCEICEHSITLDRF